MKLFIAFIGTLHGYSSPFGEPFGCNPAELEGYEITDECKENVGYHNIYNRDPNGLLLEKKGNFCRWRCKYNGRRTTHVECHCQRNSASRTVDCSYRIKLVRGGFTTKWLPFDHKEDGNYPLDKWDYGGRHATCVPDTTGEYGEWSQWKHTLGYTWRTYQCDAECGIGWQIRTRECPADHCDGLAEEARRCVGFDPGSYRYQEDFGCSRTEGKKYVMPTAIKWYNQQLGLNYYSNYLLI